MTEKTGKRVRQIVLVLNLDELPPLLDADKVARHWIGKEAKSNQVDWDTLCSVDERKNNISPITGKPGKSTYRARIYTVLLKDKPNEAQTMPSLWVQAHNAL